MDCKRPLPNVPAKTSQSEEGAVRYVTAGEARSPIADTSQGQMCYLSIQKKMDYEDRYEDRDGVYMDMPQLSKNDETKKRRDSRLLLYIIVAFTAVILLIFICAVSSRLVSLGKIIEEQQHELRHAKQARESLTTELVEMRTNISQLFSIAFHAAVYRIFPMISQGEKVKFDNVELNIGNSYDKTTGVFTVPISGGGLYFLSAHMVVDDKEYGKFLLKKNNEILCGFFEDNNNSAYEDGSGSCSATAQLSAGDELYLYTSSISSTTPVQCDSNMCGFTGFLMRPDR